MAGFEIAPNPAPNPAGFANAAASIYNALSGEAARQQQQRQVQQQQMLKDQFETELKLRKSGYTPYMQTTGQDPSGLKRRDAQQVDPSQVIQDQFGRRWVAPEAKGAATPQQNYTDLQTALDRGGQPVQNGTIYAPGGAQQEQDAQASLMSAHVPVPDASRVVTPPGSGRELYMPTGDEKAATKLQQDLRAAAAKPGASHVDTEHFSSPVLIDPKSGKATEIALPDGVTHNEKPEKKPTYRYEVNDQGVLSRFPNEEDGTPQTWNGKSWVAAGAAVGPRRRDPDAAPAPKKPTPTQLNAIEGKKRAGLVRAEVAFKRAIAGAKAGDYTDEDKVREATDSLARAKQDTQDAYEQSLNQFGIPTEHMEYPPVEAGPSTSQAGGGRGAPASATAPSGGRGAPAAAQTAPQVAEGTTVRNAKTGARLVLKGGQWVPIP